VTGTVGLPAVLLALVVCCWTPAHFYNLAIAHREDYARAEYPMLPVVAGVRTARQRILAWLGITLIAAALLGTATDLGILYALTTTILGAVFVRSVIRQYDVNQRGSERRTGGCLPELPRLERVSRRSSCGNSHRNVRGVKAESNMCVLILIMVICVPRCVSGQ